MKTSILVGSLLLAVSASAQIMVQPPPVTVQPGLCSNRIAVGQITLSKALPGPDEAFNINIPIKNLCNMQYDIAYQVIRNTGILKQGVETVPAAQTHTIAVPFSAPSGTHRFYVQLDPGNNIGDPTTADNASNTVGVTIQPVIDGQNGEVRLDLRQAAMAGAGFPVNPEAPGICSIVVQPASLGQTVEFDLDCSGPTGNKADPEAFKNFVLRNGWTIHSTSVRDSDNTHGSTIQHWNWLSPVPASGQNNPYMKLHLWASAVNVTWVQVDVKITGPHGRNAYQCEEPVYDCATGLMR